MCRVAKVGILVGRLIVAELSETFNLDEIAVGLPSRIHEVTATQVANAPDRIALIEDGASWSYHDLEQRVSEIATVLSSLGIRAGDRMIIVSENCIALAALLLATSRLDAWAIVANPRLSARELDQIRDHSGARRMFFTSSVSKEAAAHASRYGAENRRIGPLLEIDVGPLNESATVEPVEADPVKQVAVLIYTSGTTGTPKGVMLSHDNLLISAKTTAHFRKMNEDDKSYLVLPISHIVGISLLIMTLMVGGTVRMVSKYDPAATARAIAEEGVTILNGVPATYQRLLEYKSVSGVEQLARGSLRLIAVAGAPLDLNLKLRVEKEFGLPLLNGYGITECSPGISGVRFDAPRSDQAVGTLLPGVEARVRTLDGIPTARGEVGELHVRGRNVMLGYYRAPELTAKVIDSEGWFNTGDLARFDGDCLYIVGRTKEMIIRSGFNVYPAEVEAVLSSHKDVVQSAVVGRAADGNEEIVAFVQLLPGSRVTPEELMSFIRFQLTSYKRPSKIVILDALPATSTGKILKHKLAESLHGEGGETPPARAAEFSQTIDLT
jgi:long-chain acyl-CoA synthetase